MTYAILPGQVRYIQTMRRKLWGGDDAAYREMLGGMARVKSCKDLKGPQIDLVIKHLERCLGKGSMRTTGGTPVPPTGNRPSRATAAQLAEIRRRWDGLSCAQPWEREGALRKFLHRRFNVAAPEWLTLTEAQKVLNGLKAMAARGPGNALPNGEIVHAD